MGRERADRININKWVREWCCEWGFGFLCHGTDFGASHLLGEDGVYLSDKGKTIFGSKFSNSVR